MKKNKNASGYMVIGGGGREDPQRIGRHEDMGDYLGAKVASGRNAQFGKKR